MIKPVDYRALIDLYQAPAERFGKDFGFVARPDFIAAIAAVLGVTIFDTLPGLFIGIGVPLLLLIYRASQPYVAVLGREPGPDGIYGDIDRHPARPSSAHGSSDRKQPVLRNADATTARILHAAEADGVTA